jgi:hypothetical protein
MSLSGYSSSSTQTHRSTDLGSTRQPTESAPNVALHSFPSPPLSSTNSPITYLPHHPDPWFERSSRLSDQEMELSTGSVSGLEGSWRMEGEVLPRGKEKEWEIRDTHLEGERRSKMPRGVSPDKGARPLGIAVMASVMDTSKGRDKILVSSHPTFVKPGWMLRGCREENRTIFDENVPLPPVPCRRRSTTPAMVHLQFEALEISGQQSQSYPVSPLGHARMRSLMME